MRTKSLIKVGDFNTLFTLTYQRADAKARAASFVSHEKTIKVSILGSDSVAGIPLALAGFIVPGLFFWFVVNLFGAPWKVGVALGDKLIYSVLVSLGLAAAASWVGFVRPDDGVSLSVLTRLAGVGAALGALFGGADYLLRALHRRRAARLQIGADEDEQSLLRKLFTLHPRPAPEIAIIRLKNGEQYAGSLASRTETTTSLAGWFKVDSRGLPPEVGRKLRRLEKKGQLVKILDAVREAGLEIEVDDAVKQVVDDGFQTTGEAYKQWDNGDVSGLATEKAAGAKPTLRLDWSKEKAGVGLHLK